ncbi:hypothetical protein L596_023553 [Steinernema carpocapsae]|uniref:Uncharacterized protein n=1 Tax=Steinernema carpocapsae TaxID=34508 RepID=A0A4U5MES7_STECR|nr:hypothetical protein L596_023553 [Steinernema carpocapsae]
MEAGGDSGGGGVAGGGGSGGAGRGRSRSDAAGVLEWRGVGPGEGGGGVHPSPTDLLFGGGLRFLFLRLICSSDADSRRFRIFSSIAASPPSRGFLEKAGEGSKGSSDADGLRVGAGGGTRSLGADLGRNRALIAGGRGGQESGEEGEEKALAGEGFVLLVNLRELLRAKCALAMKALESRRLMISGLSDTVIHTVTQGSYKSQIARVLSVLRVPEITLDVLAVLKACNTNRISQLGPLPARIRRSDRRRRRQAIYIAISSSFSAWGAGCSSLSDAQHTFHLHITSIEYKLWELLATFFSSFVRARLPTASAGLRASPLISALRFVRPAQAVFCVSGELGHVPSPLDFSSWLHAAAPRLWPAAAPQQLRLIGPRLRFGVFTKKRKASLKARREFRVLADSKRQEDKCQKTHAIRISNAVFGFRFGGGL